jgi:hypothetical protein
VLRSREHPDDDEWYETAFEGDGALYKSESTGDWSYRGDDPDSYTDVFDQEGGSDVTDLTPLIDLLQFLDEADDATFAAELPDRVDVDAFATYLAMMDLVDNFDDIDGPGNRTFTGMRPAVTIIALDITSRSVACGRRPTATDAPPAGFDDRRTPASTRPAAGGFGQPAAGGLRPSQLPEASGPAKAAGSFSRSNPLVEVPRDAGFERCTGDGSLRAELTKQLGPGILDSWVTV